MRVDLALLFYSRMRRRESPLRWRLSLLFLVHASEKVARRGRRARRLARRHGARVKRRIKIVLVLALSARGVEEHILIRIESAVARAQLG